MPLGSKVSATGVVTAEQGRLGSSSLLAIGDVTGGIAIRVPTGTAGYPRGTLLEVRGVLAAPYGQLEIRIAADGVRSIGSETLPAPVVIGPAGLDESVEGLLATVTGTVSTKPKRSSGGDLTITLDRPGAAPIRVIADASSQLGSATFAVGTTYRIVGVVGQRSSRKGAPDGYRICLRDATDLVALFGLVAPGATPVPTGSSAGPGNSGASPGSGPDGAIAAQPIPIAQALGSSDQDVAIEAVVTAQATLLDATGRRIVVQDESGAIEVLLPSGVGAPPIGTRIRAVGRVGRAYGAPRMRAEQLDLIGSGPVPPPLVLRMPPSAAQEWRLVTITGRVENVRKLGSRWRAELLVGSQRVVVVGQPGSGLAAAALVAGRMASVTGIVRRPYPTSADQRYAITPRAPSDVRILGRSAGSAGTSGSAGAAAAGPGSATGERRAGGTVPPATAGPRLPIGAIDADLFDLAAFTGRLVRVGGLVVDLRPDGLLLDDGTTVGYIVLRGAGLDLLALLEPDDAVNVTGYVQQLPDGPAVVVDDPGGIIQAGDPIAPDGIGDNGQVTASDPPTVLESVTPSTVRAGFLVGQDLGVGLAGVAGLGTLAALSIASLSVTLLRRQHANRRLEARIAARVASFGGPIDRPPGPPVDPPAGVRSPEPAPSTIHSA